MPPPGPLLYFRKSAEVAQRRVYMRRSTIVTTLFSALLVGSAGHAQAAPNFSGDWKMNIAKSDFGGIPAPELLTRVIRQNGINLEYSTRQKGASGDVTTEL